MIEMLRKGDIVTVWRIDRLGRTTLELIKLMVEFREKGVEFKSIVESTHLPQWAGSGIC